MRRPVRRSPSRTVDKVQVLAGRCTTLAALHASRLEIDATGRLRRLARVDTNHVWLSIVLGKGWAGYSAAPAVVSRRTLRRRPGPNGRGASASHRGGAILSLPGQAGAEAEAQVAASLAAVVTSQAELRGNPLGPDSLMPGRFEHQAANLPSLTNLANPSVWLGNCAA